VSLTCMPLSSKNCRLSAVVSHISRKTSEMWGTPRSVAGFEFLVLGQGWSAVACGRARHDLDFKDRWPLLAGDEKAVSLRVVGNPIQH